MRDFFKIFCWGILVIFAGACSRVTNDNTMLSLTLPSVGEGAQSNAQLGYLVINVSGPGLPKTLVFPFDRHENQTVSNSVVIEVPAGEARLVQALAVYFDDATKAMSFYYGDSVASLSGSSSSLVLKVNSISGLENVVSGSVSGRYSASVGINPTGEVAIKYDPGSSKPAMIVDRGIIVEGWFSLFGLSGVPLIYEIESTGQILFGGVPRKLDDVYFSPSENVLLAQVPIHRRSSGGSSDLEEPNYNVIGWFGTFAATRKVCIPSSGTFSNMKVAANPATSLAASIDTLSPFMTLTNAQMFSQTTGSIHFSGGAPEGSCTTANKDISEIFTSISQFDGNGKDTATGFQVPLQKGSDGKFLALPPGGSGFLNITGKVLPGVDSVFTGIQFFKKIGPAANDDEYDSSRPFPCAEMPGRGYSFAASSSIAAGTGVFTALNVINTAADLSQGGLAVGVCFVDSSGRRVPRGGFISPHEFSGGNGGMSPATSLSIRMNEGVVPGSGLCQLGEVEFRAANGSFTSGNGATGPMTVSTQNSELLFFAESDINCVSAGTSNIALSSSMTRFRYKAAGIMSINDTDVVQAQIPINGSPISGSLNVKGVAAADMAKLDVFGPAAIAYPNSCREVQVSARTQSGGTVATEDSPINFDLRNSDGSMPTLSEVAIYDSFGECSTNSGEFLSGARVLTAGLKSIFIKQKVMGNYRLQVSYTSDQVVNFQRTMFLSGVPVGTAVKMILAQLSAPAQSQSGQCQHFRLTTQTETAGPAPANGSATISLGWAAGPPPTLYSDASCMNPLGSNQISFSGESEKVFYMKAIHNMSTPQNLNFSASFSFTGGGPMLWSETAGFTNPLPIDPWYLSSNYAGGPLATNGCYAFTFGFGTTPAFTGDRGNFTGDLVTVVLSVPSAPLGSALEIHSNPTCTAVIPGGFVDFIPGDQQKTVYLKPLQTFTGSAMTFSSPVLGQGLQIGNVGSTIQNP